MASDNYTATKEDSRLWRTDQDTRAAAKDDAATTNAAAIQTATHAANPIDTIVATPATADISAATTATDHTVQVSVSGQVGTVASSAGFSVTYESSSTGLATVSDTGLITGVSAGTATITVTAVHDTSATDDVVVTVA